MNFFNEELYFDLLIKNLLLSIASPVLDVLMIFITNLGAAITISIFTFCIVIYLTFKRKLVEGIFLVFSLITSWSIINLLKILFGRVRPEGEQLICAQGYSFPSGHAALSLVFYGFIIFLSLTADKNSRTIWLSGFFAVLIFLIGISRVYLNVHYASDVLAGFILGGILLAIFIFMLRYYKSRFFNS